VIFTLMTAEACNLKRMESELTTSS
jgi:hypothetical protein